jgi:sirohydrochlorin ferrochelatase
MAHNAETYRQQAREIAALAENAEDPAIRAELLALAERFWRLAEYLDNRERQGAPMLGLQNLSQFY